MAAPFIWLVPLVYLCLVVQLIICQDVTYDMVEQQCSFTGQEAMCRPSVLGRGGLDIQVSINPCSKPVDITFHVMNGTLHWTHTFSNEDETQQVAGLQQAYMALRVVMRPRPHNHLHVRASFLLDRDAPKDIIDQTVAVNGGEHCSSGGSNSALPIILFLFLSMLFVSTIVLAVYWRRKRLQGTKPSRLIPGQDSGSLPYQEEAITSEPISSKSKSTTVIHNTSYRDSKFLEELPTIEESCELGATAVSKGHRRKSESGAKGGRKKSKEKSKKKRALNPNPKRSKWSGRSMSDSDLAEVKQRMLVDVKTGEMIDDSLSTENTPFKV